MSSNLEKSSKNFYTSYSKLSEIRLVTIGYATPSCIKKWAEKTLPNGKIYGEVLNANTLHYKTFKPQKGGLFCERIFGPLKNFECACGKSFKYKKNLLQKKLNASNKALAGSNPNVLSTKDSSRLKALINLNDDGSNTGNFSSTGANSKDSLDKNLQYSSVDGAYSTMNSVFGNLGFYAKKRDFCDICDVEYTWSVIRRYQLGYIKLVSPIVHIWYLKGMPSYLSILLQMKRRALESIVYCSKTPTIEYALKGPPIILDSAHIISTWKKLKAEILKPVVVESSAMPSNENLSQTITVENNSIQSNSLNFIEQSSPIKQFNNTFEKLKARKIEKRKSLDVAIKKSVNTNYHKFSMVNSQKTKMQPSNTESINHVLKQRKNLSYFNWNNCGSNEKSIWSKNSNHIPQQKKLKAPPAVNRGHLPFMNGLSESLVSVGKYKFKNPNNVNSYLTMNLKKRKAFFNIELKQSFNSNYPESETIKIRNLKILSAIIYQQKYFGQLANLNTPLLVNRNDNTYIPPGILKKLSIRFYILLKLNLVSQKSIYKSFVEQAWKTTTEKAMKVALIRFNQLTQHVSLLQKLNYTNRVLRAYSLNLNKPKNLKIYSLNSKAFLGSKNIKKLIKERVIYLNRRLAKIANLLIQLKTKIGLYAEQQRSLLAQSYATNGWYNLKQVKSERMKITVNKTFSFLKNSLIQTQQTFKVAKKLLLKTSKDINLESNFQTIENNQKQLKKIWFLLKHHFILLQGQTLELPRSFNSIYPSEQMTQQKTKTILQANKSWQQSGQASSFANNTGNTRLGEKSSNPNVSDNLKTIGITKKDFYSIFELKEPLYITDQFFDEKNKKPTTKGEARKTTRNIDKSMSQRKSKPKIYYLKKEKNLNDFFASLGLDEKNLMTETHQQTIQNNLKGDAISMSDMNLLKSYFERGFIEVKRSFNSNFQPKTTMVHNPISPVDSLSENSKQKLFMTKSYTYQLNIGNIKIPTLLDTSFFLRSHFYLELYMFSNSSHDFSNHQIGAFLKNKYLQKPNYLTKNVTMIKQLSRVFFKYFIQSTNLTSSIHKKYKVWTYLKRFSTTTTGNFDLSASLKNRLLSLPPKSTLTGQLPELTQSVNANYKDLLGGRSNVNKKLLYFSNRDFEKTIKTLFGVTVPTPNKNLMFIQNKTHSKQDLNLDLESIIRNTLEQNKNKPLAALLKSKLKGNYQPHSVVEKGELELKPSFNSNNQADKQNNKTSQAFVLKNYLTPNNSNIESKDLPVKEMGINKKLYNNFYPVFHRARWSSDISWNLFYLFMTTPSENNEIVIANYRKQLEPVVPTPETLVDSLESQPWTKTSPTTEFDIQNSVFFSGPGLIKELLNEFTINELYKINYQNKILLSIENKKIADLKKNLFIQKKILNKKKWKKLKKLYKRRFFFVRKAKLVRTLFKKESYLQETILKYLPVLPPELRPIVKMGNQIASSDLNRLYQRVIYRNDRLKKFLKDPATSHSFEMKYAQRLLQEAIDNLIQNSNNGVAAEKDSRGRLLKSLSDNIKGKQGRFRQYLLGKRVDYSGRSVIVVGPKLKLHECGLPKEMALELYLPFLLKRILNENLARTVVGAKTLIKTNPSLVWELLREIMQTCPVLLNRAPTLHRLGIQAFQPKLIEGRAILLHPLVCSAFNADFDGDQMAVHVPITVEARAEAWKLMLSRNNILSPATGDPLAIPSQDMLLGCYYLTINLLNRKTQNSQPKKLDGTYFATMENVLKAYELKIVDLHSNIWLKWNQFIENGSDQEEPIEIRIDSYGNRKEISKKFQKTYNAKENFWTQYILTTPGKILFNKLIMEITGT